jgi:uncharacterized protein YerC
LAYNLFQQNTIYNKVNPTCFYYFNHFLLSSSPHETYILLNTAVTSLLQEGYSLHHIEFKTGLGKSTTGRIKEMDGDKENTKEGCPSKLSPSDK